MVPLKTNFSLSHMKDVAQMEECKGRSDEGDTDVKETLYASHLPLTVLISKSSSFALQKLQHSHFHSGLKCAK